jgi:hypothetical protein
MPTERLIQLFGIDVLVKVQGMRYINCFQAVVERRGGIRGLACYASAVLDLPLVGKRPLFGGLVRRGVSFGKTFM